MPLPLESSDRRVLIATGAILVAMTLAAMLVSPSQQGPSSGFPSSYSTASDGAKAAYLLLGELGCRVERWEEPPERLPESPQGVVLVLASPWLTASAEEKWELRQFVQAGGRLLATGEIAAGLLGEQAARPLPGFRNEPKPFSALLPGRLTRGVPQIELESRVRWGGGPPHGLEQFGDAAGATVVSYGLGKGEVVWWASSTPLTNYGLLRASNLRLFLNSVEAAPGKRVLWDEYFHGQQPGLIAHFERTPVLWGLAQCFLLATALLLTYSRRSGPVRRLESGGTRLSPLEFLETLGDLYARRRAASGAVEIAYERFRFRLARRLGLASSATSGELVQAMRDRLGPQATEFSRLLQRCEAKSKVTDLSEPEALKLVRELHEETRRWGLDGRTRGA